MIKFLDGPGSSPGPFQLVVPHSSFKGQFSLARHGYHSPFPGFSYGPFNSTHMCPPPLFGPDSSFGGQQHLKGTFPLRGTLNYINDNPNNELINNEPIFIKLSLTIYKSQPY